MSQAAHHVDYLRETPADAGTVPLESALSRFRNLESPTDR